MADERRRIRVGAAQQPEKILAPALLVAREAQCRDQHRGEDLLHAHGARARFALELLQEFDALGVHGIEPSREDRLEQFFLGAEVVVHGGQVHAGRGSEAAQARGLEAVLHEELLGRIEDAGLGIRGGCFDRHALAGRPGCRHG